MSGTGPGRRGVWWLIAVTGAVALMVQWVLVRPLGHGASSSGLHLPLIAVVVGFALAEVFVVHLRLGRNAYAFSLSEIPLVIGLFFVRPDLLVLARLSGAVLIFCLRRSPLRKLTFNCALFALEAALAVVLWHVALGNTSPLGPRGWAATALVALVTSTVGSALVSLAITIDTRQRPSTLFEVFSLGPLVDLVNASFALVAVYVLSVDWRAGWMLGVVILVLVTAHRSYERLHRRTETLEQLNHFTAHVGRQLDVDAVVRAVLIDVRDAIEAHSVHLWLNDETEAPRHWALGPGQDTPTSSAASAVLEAFSPLLADEPLLVPRRTRRPALAAALRSAGVRDFLAVPLRSEGRSLGVLAVADRLGDMETFTADDARQLGAHANHAGLALVNASRADLLRRQAAEREHQATHDELTGLANRRLFGARLEHVLAHESASVLLLDLDRFKEINDTLGHQVGDDLLCLVARRVRDTAPSDALVARFGGDEFAVLLPGADRLDALACASLVRAALNPPFDLDGITVSADASIGVAVAEPGAEAVGVVRQADVAMYAAKSAHRGVEVYRPDLDGYDPARLGLLADLRDAVARNALTVVYQPKVDLARARVHGVEALVRWDHPRHGPIGPDEFIPLAEHGNLITPLTMLVLRQALDQCQSWRAQGGPPNVAVNISPRSLHDPSFVDQVAHALAAVAVPAGALTLEITETSLMAEPERAIAALDRLHSLGVRLSVDDLGTGYSSLAYLQRLPVDEIKIDRSFLQALPDPSAEAVIGAVIDLGHRLARHVVAEGIEDESAWALLQNLGCDSAQGFWISRPLPADEMPAFLQQWRGTSHRKLHSVV